jgi:hypothetical protein
VSGRRLERLMQQGFRVQMDEWEVQGDASRYFALPPNHLKLIIAC